VKILQVIDSLEIGGAEVLLRDFVPRLRQRGIDVTVAILNSTGSYLEQELQNMGVCILPTIRASLYSPRHIFWLAHMLQRFDVVHVHLFPAQLWVAMASRLTGERTVLVTTEHSTYNRRRKVWFRPLDRFMYSSYHFIACISPATASALINWVPDIAGKVTVVPNGINLERFRNARAASKSEILHDVSRPVILSIGRFEPPKDHATILRAMVKVPDAQLVLVGDGEMRQRLEGLAVSFGIANRVHFLGRRQDIPELIKMADIYIQSSNWEGFGIAALESMAGGLPVIASNVPGLSHIVEGAGILFPPGDSDALATAILSLLSSPELRSKLSQAGMEKANTFSIDQTADLYMDLYWRCVNDLIA
jgi:glycosyltransferase involved in cell wall biosynthesis